MKKVKTLDLILNYQNCLLFLMFFLLLHPLSGQTIIDDFSTDQALQSVLFTPATDHVEITGGGILGGERDISLTLTSGAIVQQQAMNGENTASQSTATGNSLLTWDGVDSDASTLDPTGLGGVDLTVGGAESFAFEIRSSASSPSNHTVTVYTDGANASEATIAIPNLPHFETILIPFSDFTTTIGVGADFTNVGAITLFIDLPANFSYSLIKDFSAIAPVPVVSISAMTATTIEDTGSDLVFRFSRTEDNSASLEVNFMVSELLEDSDFLVKEGGIGLVNYEESSNSGTITFPANSSIIDLIIEVSNDGIVELDEKVVINIVNP